jgi:hypothetical protein
MTGLAVRAAPFAPLNSGPEKRSARTAYFGFIRASAHPFRASVLKDHGLISPDVRSRGETKYRFPVLHGGIGVVDLAVAPAGEALEFVSFVCQ